MVASSDPLAQTDEAVGEAVEEDEQEERDKVRHKGLRFRSESKVGINASSV